MTALPYVYRVTKYDPADRDEHGRYIGSEDSVSDHGPVEAAYLRAVAAFAEDTGVHQLAIREPEIAPSPASFGLEPAVEGFGLTGLFSPDLAGFHDGALVPLSAGLALLRAMLRDNGAWCRLEAEGAFAVHVGWDQYVYVGSSEPCHGALAKARELGLFPERIDASPYDADLDLDLDRDEHSGVQRPADDEFWTRLETCVVSWKTALLEEGYVANASRWHRLTAESLAATRARLAPRARLTVWPDLSTDVGAVLDALPAAAAAGGAVEVIWEGEDGQITSTIADKTDLAKLSGKLATARAIVAIPLTVDDRHPLMTAVLPDPDGVLRARWRTEPTPSDLDWAFLKTLHRGQIVTGTVTRIATFGVTFVDIGGFNAMINIPELSWRHVAHPADVLTVGQEITAVILDVDMVRERVPLSIKALQEDPMAEVKRRIGATVTGQVTNLVPTGAFVRIEDRDDGLEGLVAASELIGGGQGTLADAVQIGDTLSVKITEVDLAERRITLRLVARASDPSL